MEENSATPPPPPPPPPAPAAVPPPPPGQRNTGMLILAYLGILALIPLLVQKDDREVQWHAKHGLVLTAAYIVVEFALMFMGWVVHFLWMLAPLVGFAYFIVAIIGIVKALKGERLIIPGLSELADKF